MCSIVCECRYSTVKILVVSVGAAIISEYYWLTIYYYTTKFIKLFNTEYVKSIKLIIFPNYIHYYFKSIIVFIIKAETFFTNVECLILNYE